MSLRLVAVGVALVLSSPSLVGQQLDRRDRDEPELIVEAGGRYSTCDALRFTPDGRFLLAGGDDKVVRVWPHAAAGLDTTKAKTLRWRAWREQRGGIKDLAVSPDGRRVAVGGFGMRPGTVAVLDRETGDTLALTWPQSRGGIDNFGTVTAVAIHPDGKRIGFGTADGSLWVWEPTKLQQETRDGRAWNPPLRAGKHEVLADRDGNQEFNFPRLVFFRDAATLVSVAQSGQVLACEIGGPLSDDPAAPVPAGKALFHVNDALPEPYRVYRAELTPDGNGLVAAFSGPAVGYRSLDGKRSAVITLPAGSFPRSITVHPRTGRLAVGVGAVLMPPAGKPRFYADGHDTIHLYESPAAGGQPKAAGTFPHRGRAEAVAFHPTDDRLAVAGGDADEVTLYDLAITDKPVSVVRGAGRKPWAVNVGEGGLVIGVRVGRDAGSTDPNRRGAGDWYRFDLTRLAATADASQRWADPLDAADGWSVVPDENDRFVWHAALQKPGAVPTRFRLQLDRARDLAPSCFTFIPAKGGAPTRLLVGHYYGCSLYDLEPARAVKDERGMALVMPRSRLFTGHAGEVTSVVAAPDGTWFLTGGADQTVSAFTLRDWASQPILGASFALGDGRVEVSSVDPGSPGWEAGLAKGDILDLLAVGGRLVFDRRNGATVGDAKAAAELLKEPRPGVELFFGCAAREKAPRKETLTTVRQRPMWKWFPAFNDQGRLTDWVVWMWHGSYYHTRTAHGDRLVGWHVNAPAVGDRPVFYQLQQFEKVFHRPDVIEKVLATRDAGSALVEARGPNPLPVSFTGFEPAPVRLALDKSVVGPAGLALTVTAAPRGNNPDLLPERVELWVNDYRRAVWPAGGKEPFRKEVTIPPGAFRPGENQITVLTFNPAGGRAEESRVVTYSEKPRPPRLLGLGVGINDYSTHRKAVAGARAFGDLLSARKDAETFAGRLLEYRGAGRFFPEGDFDLRLDSEAARKKLVADLAALANKATPYDLLIVFYAGHGDLVLPKDEDRPQPGGKRAGAAATGAGSFVLCCPDYIPEKAADTAISSEELFDGLARINCRKVVLMDACHSGRAADANLLRRLIPNGQGPFMIASCDQGELSYEDPKFGHGLFTFALLEALGPRFRRADADADGALTGEELYGYLAGRLPELLRQSGKPTASQNPICFPRTPPRFAVVKQ